jgi:hypothetical protein
MDVRFAVNRGDRWNSGEVRVGKTLDEAIAKLTDRDLLEQLAENAKSKSVREAAQAKHVL